MIAALRQMLPWNATVENPSWSLDDPASYDDLFGPGSKSDAGITVTPDAALGIAAFWQGCAIISGDVALATLNVHKDGDDREIDKKHPAQFLVSSEWNGMTPAFDGWRRAVLHALIWGNGYVYAERNSRSGPPLGLFNLLPDRTVPTWLPSGQLVYQTQVAGKQEVLYPEEVLHLKGLSLSSGVGLVLTQYLRNVYGLALATQGFASKFFANGSQSGGTLEIPSTWTETAKNNLEEGWAKRTSGKDNWFKTVILREGAKFHQTTISPQDGQMAEMSERQVREVARSLNLLPFKLGIDGSVSYNSQEQGQIQHVTGCLSHWFAAIDGECELKLLTTQERRTGSHYFEHNYSKLIEADSMTMASVAVQLRNAEIVNANEVRRKLNMPKRKDPGGDDYMNPNTKSAQQGQPKDPPPKEDPPPPKDKGKALSPAARAVCVDAINRITRRVCLDVRREAKNSARLLAWLDSRGQDHRELFHEIIMPAAMLAAEPTGVAGDDVCYAWGGRFFTWLVGVIDPVTKPPFSSAELEKNVDERCKVFELAVAGDLLRPLFGSEGDAEESN